jgi:hypothetical protein
MFLKIKLLKQSSILAVCVGASFAQCNSLSVSLRIIFYLSENSSFQRLQIIHISLTRFNPSGSLLEWAAAQEHTSLGQRTISHQNLASRPNLCSIVISLNVRRACEFDGKNLSACT